MQLAVPQLRTPTAQRNFNNELANVNYNLNDWRYIVFPRRLFLHPRPGRSLEVRLLRVVAVPNRWHAFGSLNALPMRAL